MDDDRLVATFMRELADARPVIGPQLVEPGVLWWKAQLLRRWDAERRATAPIEVMEPVQIVAGLATAALLLLWALPSLKHLLTLG
jgi:hypothetical protein